MPQAYARDLAITAVICFIGGVGLTLLVVLICYRVSHRKKVKESKIQQKEEERTTRAINSYVSHPELGGQPLDRKAMMLENHGGQFWSRADEVRNHVRCPDCSTKGQRGMGQNPMRWKNGINREVETEEQRQKRRMRMMTEEEMRKPGTQRGGILSLRDIPSKLLSPGNSSSSPHTQRETFNETLETLSAYKTSRDMDSYRTNVEAMNSRHETLHCKSCHRSYRTPEQMMRSGRIHTNMRDSALFDSSPLLHSNSNQFDVMRNSELRRESKNVTFDLDCLKNLEQRNIHGEDKRGEKERSSRDKEKERKRKQKVKIQSGRLLKVKLNLSPLRKSKVHPKRTDEQGHSDKSKKSKEKMQDGKERQEKEGKRNCSNKTKVSSKKKSSKSKGSDEKDEEEEDGGEGNSKSTSKEKKTTSKSEQGGHENTALHQNADPDKPLSADTTNAADQSASATGHGQNVQSSVLGSAQFSSQQPLSRSAAESNTSLSLLGSAGSHLTASSLSVVLNTMAPGSKAMFPNGPASSINPNIGSNGPNLTSTGVLESLSRQTAVGLMSASAIQTTPLNNLQAGGFASNFAANPALYPLPIQPCPQSQLAPDSSALVAKLKSDPFQGPGLQTGEGQHQLPPESQALQTKENLPVQAQAPISTDGLCGLTSQAVESVIAAENLSNNNSQIGSGSVPGVSTVNTLTGGMVQTEGPVVGGSVDSMQAANVSVTGISGPSMSTRGRSSTGAAAVAATGPTLLQQEYMSEEGGSPLRRKLRLVLPEKTSSRPPTALERKIR